MFDCVVGLEYRFNVSVQEFGFLHLGWSWISAPPAFRDHYNFFLFVHFFPIFSAGFALLWSSNV